MRVLIFCITVLILHCQAQEMDKARLDTLFNRLDRYEKFMGSAAIYKDGKLFYKRAIGRLDSLGNRKADAETRYRIGSITKTFTATLIMKSVELGKISLDDRLSKWYPSVKNADSITIKHLLSHRSGIVNFTNASDYLRWNTQPQSKEQIIERIVKAGSSFRPGTKMEYSNSAYFLLGSILEQVHGKTYVQLLQRYIFKPAGLRHTGIGGKIDVTKNECASFWYQKRWVMSTETDMSVPYSAGNIISTPDDICRFANQLFNGNIISPISVELMQSFNDNVGLGLFRFPFNDKWSSGHTGGIDAFQSVYGYLKDGKVSIALFSNGTNYINNDITIALLSAAYGIPFTLPDFNVRLLPAEILSQYKGIYACKELPLKLTFTAREGVLICQATGQPAFELDPVKEHQFSKSQYNIDVVFDTAKKQLRFTQGGKTFLFEQQQ